MKYLSILALASLLAVAGFGQAATPTGGLKGLVTDPSGAVVPNAQIAVLVSGGQTYSATTGRNGSYELPNLPPGKYTVTANAQGFAVFVQNDVEVTAGKTTQFSISLDILVEKEKISVQENTPQVDTNPASNASAIVLSGKDLDALADDPDELQSDLEALAGPSAGPNGGQIYIDGFTGGQLPPKASIREIRINQNPFSAEFDRLGYGRIEVFTKPGTDKYHGQFSVEGNSSAMNSRNPYLGNATQQPYDSVTYMGSLGGPINKKASFFISAQRRNINEIAVVNAQVLDTDYQPVAFQASVPNPRTRTNIGPRLDYQLTPNNTLVVHYHYFNDTQDNAGVGQFSLPQSGYNTSSSEHSLQFTDTQIFGAKIINETRFEYERDSSRRTPLSTALSIVVPQSFTGGGYSGGADADHTNDFELQNYTSMALGKHFLKFGGRLRTTQETDISSAGFNGSYSFPDLQTYANALQGLSNGTPTQFSINATASGNIPRVGATVADAGVYVQDDWKIRPTFTLSGGLRFETQNAIHDHADVAPRLGFAWGIGGGGKSAPQTVLRGGFGIFYDRFGEALVLNADRNDGVTQQQYLVSTPDFFPAIPPLGSLTAQQQTIYKISPTLHSPYIMQTAFSLERQVSKIANVTVSYLNARGVHQFVSLNVNAPMPGTPGSTGPVPYPNQGPIFQYSSSGVFRQNQLIANFNVRAGAKVSLFGYYALNYANSDAAGAGSFASDSYNLGADYGRAAFATRHRLFLGGSVALRYGFRISPFLVFNSGSPYNVTVGQDLNHDGILNDRPSFAPSPSGVCASVLQQCHYNISPAATDTLVPINYLTGPSNFTLNLRLAKTFGFGPEKSKSADSGQGPGGPSPMGGPRGPGGYGRPGGGGPFGAPGSNRRYSVTFSVNARNVLNNVNPATPVGNLSSQRFGQSVALAGGPFSSAAANRKIEVQAMFSF